MFVRVVLPLLGLGLVIYSLLDLFGTEERDLGGLPRWLWAVIIVILPVLGPVTWIVFRLSRRRSGHAYGNGTWGAGGRPGRPGRGPRRPSGPVAPDDDPDFLWRLEQERRRQQRGSAGGTGAAGDVPEGDATNGDATGSGNDGDGTPG